MTRWTAGGLRALVMVSLASGAALGAAAPALADPVDAARLIPVIDCVSAALGATPDAFTVVFGYRNDSGGRLDLPAGSAANTFTLLGDRGQPTTFETGEHHGAFATTFAGGASDLVWTLGGGTASIVPGTPSCDTATRVSLALPAHATAGGPLDVTATVTRMLLAPPTTGSVEFSVDSTVVGTAPLDAAGVARSVLDEVTAGAHVVQARYLPQTGSPQLLGATASGAVSVAAPSAVSIVGAGLSSDRHTATLTVSRTGSDGPAQVDYATADGSATAGRDYTASRGTVRFADGQSTATVSIPLLTRPFGSPSATFFVLLQRASTTVDTAGATVVLPQVTIADTSDGSVAPLPGGLIGTSSGPFAGPHSDALAPVSVTAQAQAPAQAPAATGSGSDFGTLIGGGLLTLGAALAVIGLARFGLSRKASEV